MTDSSGQDDVVAGEEKSSPAAAVAPKKKAAPKPVTFRAAARNKRVYDAGGQVVARFEDGVFTTDDPSLKKVLGALDGVYHDED